MTVKKTILTYAYDSWGAVTFSVTSIKDMAAAVALSFVNPFTYRSYCYDYDIELYYLQSRYYSPEIGRFINTDDTQIAIATQGNILGANLFAYCENNPINDSDPSGYLSLDSLKEALKKAVSTLQKWAATIRKEFKAEAKRFIKIIKYEKGKLSVSVTAASLIIDAVITACSKLPFPSPVSSAFAINSWRIKEAISVGVNCSPSRLNLFLISDLSIHSLSPIRDLTDVNTSSGLMITYCFACFPTTTESFLRFLNLTAEGIERLPSIGITCI